MQESYKPDSDGVIHIKDIRKITVVGGPKGPHEITVATPIPPPEPPASPPTPTTNPNQS